MTAVAMAARGELLRGGSVLRWWEEAGGGFGGAGEEEDDGLLCVCERESWLRGLGCIARGPGRAGPGRRDELGLVPALTRP